MRFSCAALLLLGVGALQKPAVADTGTDLAELLAAQPAEVQARYPYRHPQATLEFFGVQPGMLLSRVGCRQINVRTINRTASRRDVA
jgi:predicted methyltransferase